jgi:hypothetical protein
MSAKHWTAAAEREIKRAGMRFNQHTSFQNVFERRNSAVGALELMEAFLNLLSFCGLRRGNAAPASDDLQTSRLAGIGVVFKHAGAAHFICCLQLSLSRLKLSFRRLSRCQISRSRRPCAIEREGGGG